MISNLSAVLSDNSSRMKKSAIREILKLTQKKGIISFAGGLPAPETFPVHDLEEITTEVLQQDGAMALQYGTTEGDSLLRELLVERYRKQGLDINVGNLIITTASQQALDLIPKILINPGDKIIVELPSYLGAISAFRSYGAQLVGIEMDAHGMRSDLLEATLAEMQKNGEKPKYIYIIPDFQNPTGITMPENRRVEILAIAKKYDILIVEDSPYREVRFEGTPQKTIYELDGSGQVILLGTFSKIFVPGFRLGWVIAHEDIIDKIVTAKQSTDLCTSAFIQKITARYMQKGYFEKNMNGIIAPYREKRDTMLKALHDFMPQGVTWTEPEGGLFLFLSLPKNLDAEELFQIALDENVAFVLGTVFYSDNHGKNTMRLNFSFPTKEQNREGVRRLAVSIQKLLEQKRF